MSPERTRKRGLTTSPAISTSIIQYDSWQPDNPPVLIVKVADQPDWMTLLADASVITDTVSETGANASGDYTMARPCHHYSVVGSSLHPVSVPWQVSRYYGQCTFDVRGIPFGDGSFANDFVCPDPPTEIISQFAIKCMDEMETMFPPEQDFLSFVLELKSLVGVIDSLADIAAFLEDMANYNHVSIRRAAKIHAGYNFGVSPILGDFEDLWSTFRRVKKRIEWLIRNSGKWARVGSQMDYTLDEDTTWTGFGFAGWSPGVQLFRIKQTMKLFATARVKQNLPAEISDWLLFVKGVIGTAGLDRPLTTFWEQTPFSWAVDYFIPVGEYLKQAQHYVDPNWTVRDPSWSVTGHYDFRLRTSNHLGDPVEAGGFRLKAYRRRTGLPEWEFYQKTPSLKQWSLLAAVAIQED